MTTGAETRAEKAQRTRAAILAAALELFLARGYRATSLRDVAAAAGISHPGLQRHFATKAILLTAVVDELAARGVERATVETGFISVTELARFNDEIHGYHELYSALVGEAASPQHPAHQHIRERYELVRGLTTDMFAALVPDSVSPERDPWGEAVQMLALWDGLQLLQAYLPDRVSVVEVLARSEAELKLPPSGSAAPLPQTDDFTPAPGLPAFARRDPDPAPEQGYRVGRERRAHIVADAMTLFAREGYAGTSLREIAASAGVTKSALLHHFASKEELLDEVLVERDRDIQAGFQFSVGGRAADALRELPNGATHNSANAPGLIQLYSVLTCEALHEQHPAHAHFEQRFVQGLDYFAALFRAAQADGDLPADRDPEYEAIRLIALWDGLQFQWLYDPAEIDVARHLRAHLDAILVPTSR